MSKPVVLQAAYLRGVGNAWSLIHSLPEYEWKGVKDELRYILTLKPGPGPEVTEYIRGTLETLETLQEGKTQCTDAN